MHALGIKKRHTLLPKQRGVVLTLTREMHICHELSMHLRLHASADAQTQTYRHGIHAY